MNSKILLVSIALLVVLVGGFFIYEKIGVTQQQPVAVVNNNPNAGNPQPQPTPTATNTPPAVVPPVAGGLKDGTYLGDETSSMYGKAKVQVVIASGKIVDVQYVEYPNDRPATTAKSQTSMPIVKQEVIQAQSANVNTVSGATQTSASFIQSIASALVKAA